MKRCIESYQSVHNALCERGKNAVTASRKQQTEYAQNNIQVAEAVTDFKSMDKPVVTLQNIRRPKATMPDRFFAPIIPNSIVEESSVSIYDSEVTHSDQMDMNALYLSLLGIMAEEIPVETSFRETLLNRAAALLFGEASIAHFATQSNLNQANCELYSDGQKYVDAGKLKHYVLTAQSFYDILANRGVPTVDVHDFVHHAAQFRTWPHFYVPLYNIAALVNNELTEEDIAECTQVYRIKQLISFISFATAEYSVVADGNPLNNYSFGCLLYQYPRKSPMSKVNLLKDNVSPREFTHWNSLRALMSLQRRVLEARHIFGNNIDWLTDLGYSLPEKYHPTVDKKGKTLNEPLRHVDRSHQIDFDGLRFPDGPVALFENATELLLTELQSSQFEQTIQKASAANIESWAEVMNRKYGTN